MNRTHGRIELAAVAVAAATLGATILAASAAHWWLGDLAVHFRLQYAAAALAALATLAWMRSWGWAAAALLALAVNVTAAARAPGEAPRPTMEGRAVASVGAHVRIASINVLYANVHYDRVIAFLRAAQPDAAVLVEITPRWRSALAELRDRYPYQYYASGWRQGSGAPRQQGTLLLSRWPLEHIMPIPMGPGADPTVVASFEAHGHLLHLIGVHTTWPLGPRVSAERNRQFEELAALARAMPAPLVMAGDFNVTPFSPHFRALLEESGLRWAAQGAGWQPTWPTFLPPGGIEIDHALVSPSITVVKFQRGPRVGSDHRPILIDVTW